MWSYMNVTWSYVIICGHIWLYVVIWTYLYNIFCHISTSYYFEAGLLLRLITQAHKKKSCLRHGSDHHISMYFHSLISNMTLVLSQHVWIFLYSQKIPKKNIKNRITHHETFIVWAYRFKLKILWRLTTLS